MARKIEEVIKKTTKLHNDTAALYEALADNEQGEARRLIFEMRDSLKDIQDNLLTKQN